MAEVENNVEICVLQVNDLAFFKKFIDQLDPIPFWSDTDPRTLFLMKMLLF